MSIITYLYNYFCCTSVERSPEINPVSSYQIEEEPPPYYL